MHGSRSSGAGGLLASHEKQRGTQCNRGVSGESHYALLLGDSVSVWVDVNVAHVDIIKASSTLEGKRGKPQDEKVQERGRNRTTVSSQQADDEPR